jgi:hypothetical protein
VDIYIYIYIYIFMAMYSFAPTFLWQNFVVCRHVSEKFGCAAGEKTMNTALRERIRLRLFEKRALRRIFISERASSLSGRCRKLHDEETRNLPSSQNVTAMNKTTCTWNIAHVRKRVKIHVRICDRMISWSVRYSKSFVVGDKDERRCALRRWYKCGVWKHKDTLPEVGGEGVSRDTPCLGFSCLQ